MAAARAASCGVERCMSVPAFRWARKQADLPSSQKFVLLMLGDYFSDEWGRAWPSLGRLAEDTGLNRSTIERAIKSLRDRGLVVREEWTMNSGVERMNNRYLLPGHRPEVTPASVQPVIASPMQGDRVPAGLRKVPGKNLTIEVDALL